MARCAGRKTGELKGLGQRRAQAPRTRRTHDFEGLHWGAGHVRGKRTLNMACMFVTLVVSRFSGWLNCFAACRVEGRACDAGRGVRGPEGAGAKGRGAAASASGTHAEYPRL